MPSLTKRKICAVFVLRNVVQQMTRAFQFNQLNIGALADKRHCIPFNGHGQVFIAV